MKTTVSVCSGQGECGGDCWRCRYNRLSRRCSDRAKWLEKDLRFARGMAWLVGIVAVSLLFTATIRFTQVLNELDECRAVIEDALEVHKEGLRTVRLGRKAVDECIQQLRNGGNQP